LADKKLETLAYRLNDISSLRNLFSELNFDFADNPVNKDNWNDDQKKIVQEARIIASKDDYQIYYIQTNTDSLKEWKAISTKIIKENHGLCMICAHNPNGFKWVFSSLSKEFSKSFSETRHVPIDIKPDTGIPKTFVDFLEKIKVSKDSTGTSIVSQVSEAFDSFAVQIHDELTVNVFEALKVISEGIILDESNNFILDEQTLEEIREPVFILLYRIIFILYAEDRGIFPTEQKIYQEKFSLKWLKEKWLLYSENQKKLSEYDVQNRLWGFFRLIELGSEDLGYDSKEFFMRAYYGRLFDRKINFKLNKWKIKNQYLLDAISLLTRTHDKKGNYFFLDYSALETRHLGSIYEHLLDFHLTVKNKKIKDLPNPSDRKSSGSYYTPDKIVELVVKDSIEPTISKIIDESSNNDEIIEKILSLKILDPAMGSGHFLIGVVEFLAKRLCEIKFEKISESQYAEMKREVVRKCIYGVDRNSLAVDLAKLSLWLETLSIEKPLTFLSAHLKHGNSLIGESINSIFDSQKTLFETKTLTHFKNSVKNFLAFEYIEDDSASAVKTKIEKYSKMQEKGTTFHQLKGVLDHRLAERFGHKSTPWRDLRQKVGVESLDFYASVENESVNELVERIKFFHWELEFPEIFYENNGKLKENPGFDIIIGNPPWEVLKPNIDEFCSIFYENKENTKFSKLKKIEKDKFFKSIIQNDQTNQQWEQYKKEISSQTEYFNQSGFYNFQKSNSGKPSFSELNTYRLFLEKSFNLLKNEGYCGLVIPSNFYSEYNTQKLRELIFEKTKIYSLYDFDNKNAIFKGIHRQLRFMTLVFSKAGQTQKFNTSFLIRELDFIKDIQHNCIEYDYEFVKTTSPQTHSIVACSSKTDLEIMEKLFQHPLLITDSDWNLNFAQGDFNSSSHVSFFNTKNKGVILYEGKTMNQFTNKYSVPRYHIELKPAIEKLRKAEERKMKSSIKKFQNIKKSNITLPPVKLYFQYYRLAWRHVSSSTNSRTLICTILPPNTFQSDSLYFIKPIYFDGVEYQNSIAYTDTVFLCGILNSFTMDFVIRHKVSINVSTFFVHEIPVPRFNQQNEYHNEIVKLSGGLICTSKEFNDLKNEIGLKESITEIESRQLAKAKIDAYVAKIYSLTRNELNYILDTFPSVEKLEKILVLDEFDKLSKKK
jgi:hypothetical protein